MPEQLHVLFYEYVPDVAEDPCQPAGLVTSRHVEPFLDVTT